IYKIQQSNHTDCLYIVRRTSIIAIEISDRVIKSCRNIYRKVKEPIREAKSFYSDGKSCYNKVAFERYMPQEKLAVTKSGTCFDRE
ncbi:MAG: hypothetical protein LE180_06055, partial [Endomicrobium sp.]|uniref:hypothetical protein n=1 Tax=Candidatus Endomicrobiellum pyrsonymphae TaxID=1408203 RepID=UPI003589B89F|nr:hypothetical protein [Endomicrobium sp.]